MACRYHRHRYLQAITNDFFSLKFQHYLVCGNNRVSYDLFRIPVDCRNKMSMITGRIYRTITL